MKKTQKIMGVVAVTAMGFGLLSPLAHANQYISGSIQIGGTANLNAALGTATEVLSVVSSPLNKASKVVIGSGAYAGTGGEYVTWGTPFGWTPQLLPPANTALWSFYDAGNGFTYSFFLTSDSVVTHNATTLQLSGTGDAWITGVGSPYLETAGTWTFTITTTPAQENQAKFTFGSGTTDVGVPDGGLTIALLGLALTGVGALRMKQSK
jgi:hypothetical protein